MNEESNEEQGSGTSEEQGGEPTSWEATTSDTPPVPDSPATQQHPLTQPVPHVQPPSEAPYPGRPIGVTVDELYPAGARPAPASPWAPTPAPGA